jgi:cellulose synthase/poly-beta-1,6-N-acetylglucosamine synthase-like glycosyltransferase
MVHNLVLVLYSITLVGLACFALHRVKMLGMYLWAARKKPRQATLPAGELPLVCVQCPLFNEPLVVEALLEKVTMLRWPAARLEIQILDDSNDETPAIIMRWLQAHPELAANVKHIRRPNRQGYKAGALAYGNTQTKAEFFAIFDADFRPEPDFLEQLIPHFADPKVAVVQARWEFMNRYSSLLTRFQGIFLDAHFIVEQAARYGNNLFLNFNGTAGVWRRTAMEDAGGWSADTVTEDLDLSYRAQRRGWKFVYLEHYTVPSELPENLTAFKSQQHRWTKGGIQVARKQLRDILRSDLPGAVKRESVAHLGIGFVHPLLVTFSILFVPYLYIVGAQPTGIWHFLNPLSVLLTGGTTVMFYIVGQYFLRRQWREGLIMLVSSPLLLAFGLALSVTCCVAAFEGMVTLGGEFVRTPKGGRAVTVGGLVACLRSRTMFTAIMFIETAIGALMLAGALYFQRNEMLPVAIVLLVKATGFLGMAALSMPDLLPKFGGRTAPV